MNIEKKGMNLVIKMGETSIDNLFEFGKYIAPQFRNNYISMVETTKETSEHLAFLAKEGYEGKEKIESMKATIRDSKIEKDRLIEENRSKTLPNDCGSKVYHIDQLSLRTRATACLSFYGNKFTDSNKKLTREIEEFYGIESEITDNENIRKILVQLHNGNSILQKSSHKNRLVLLQEYYDFNIFEFSGGTLHAVDKDFYPILERLEELLEKNKSGINDMIIDNRIPEVIKNMK